MTTWFVSRHPGALEWARRRGIEARALTHLDPSTIQPGDAVIGSLPLHMAAEVCKRGATYFHITMRVPQALRGKELDADEMDQLGADMRAYEVHEARDSTPHDIRQRNEAGSR